MTAPAIPAEPPDFSLVLGGPLFQAFRRAHLSGDALELVRRRVLVLAGVAWVPLLLLSAVAGQALGGGIEIPFLQDIEVHVRFLIALPILIGAELVVHRRIRSVVARFVREGIVIPEDRPALDQAIGSALRVRDSALAELALLVAIYTLGLWASQQQIFALGAASWYATPHAAKTHLTPAGYWYVFVSIPLFQLILLRWYFRLFIWFWFLWRVSRLSLRLRPLHPDRAAGLGFLSGSIYAFSPIVVAQSAVVAGQLASLIIHAGRSLMGFKVGVVGFLAFLMASIVGPLTVFAPNLWRARRDALAAFGSLASRYVETFEEKWLAGNATKPLPGSAAVQTLSDLGNSYRAIQDTRLMPFGWRDVALLAGIAVLPLLPLMLTVLSVEDLVDRLIKVLL